MYNYTELTFTDLVNKIANARFWDLPKMVAEAFKKLLNRVEALEDAPTPTGIESITGDFVDNTDPLNPEINVNEINLGQVINDRLSIKITPSPNDEIVMLDSITGEAVTAFYSSIKPYKVYTGFLSQTGTSAPIVTILENTLGNIVWTRQSAGKYRGTLVGAFTADKTFIPPYSSDFSGNSVFLPLSVNGNPQLGWINMYIGGTDDIIIDTYDLIDRSEWSTIIGTSKIPIEIRVYN